MRGRKEKDKDQMRNLILDAASKIISNEGIEKLSIRKIANIIEYSPTIIYHYFTDKDDIIFQFISTRYFEIMQNVLKQNATEVNSIDKLKNMVYSYIKTVLENPDIYKAIMLSSDKRVLEHTSVLFEGATNDRKLMNIFRKLIEQVIKGNNLSSDKIEITIQIIWTSIFGLIMRLIIEKDISENLKEGLIKNHIDIMIDRVLLYK